MENMEVKEMDYNDIISNVKTAFMEESIKGSKYPMSVDLTKPTDEITKTVLALAQSGNGEAHDQFLTGIQVCFDLTFTNKAWVEGERYRFLYFISSQSTMHRISKFDFDKSYIEYVDPRVIEIMKEKKASYERVLEAKKFATEAGDKERIKEAEELEKRLYLEMLYTNPAGFKITAKMVTNYRQLKTIYAQRRDHRLPEWRAFCRWIETLPNSELITGAVKKKELANRQKWLLVSHNDGTGGADAFDVEKYLSKEDANVAMVQAIETIAQKSVDTLVDDGALDIEDGCATLEYMGVTYGFVVKPDKNI